MTIEAIQSALKGVKYPGFSRDIVSFGLVRSVDFTDGTATVKLAVTTSDPSIPPKIRDAVESAVAAISGVRSADVEIAVSQASAPPKAVRAGSNEATALPGIKYVVAVASGKGGVGKSTFSVNFACALAERLRERSPSLRVGLMDCDIYGPTVPLMIGLKGRPQIDGESLVPMEAHGVKVMSMGFLVDDDTPVVWRGPMIMKTIQQFVQNVNWGELEVLVVDLPPGTGDAQLSLVQTIPLTGAVLVTTPQLAATQIARKGGLMLEKVNVPVLGVVENMSYFEDPASGQRNYLFGQGGGARTADMLGTDLLGQIPLDPAIRESGDVGDPIALSGPESAPANAFRRIAEAVYEKCTQEKA